MFSDENKPWVADIKVCLKCHWHRDGKCGFRGFEIIAPKHVRKGSPRCKGPSVPDKNGLMNR